MTEVVLQRLTKSYDGEHNAVADFSLTAQRGQITALLGPSGCGKTTLLQMIAGLLAPDGGDVWFNGRSVLDTPAERRGAVMVFQNHLLFPYMSVGENVGFGLRMRGVDKREIAARVAQMLELVRLPGFAARRPHELSGGQQQRVALARALIVEPQVLLLDEPLSNLDAHLRGEMRDLIFNLQRKLDITTIFVTHDQEEAVILADQIALIFNGRLQQVGPPEDFYERPLTPQIARFFGGVNFIPGYKWGAQVETTLGVFVPAGASDLPDGPVTLTIRPENLAFCNGNGVWEDEEPDTVPGQILSHLYVGTHTRFRVTAVDANLPPLELVADAASQRRYRDGDGVRLHFPADKLWVMAREESG